MRSFLNLKHSIKVSISFIFVLMFAAATSNVMASTPADLEKTMTVRSTDASGTFRTCVVWPKASITDNLNCGCATDGELAGKFSDIKEEPQTLLSAFTIVRPLTSHEQSLCNAAYTAIPKPVTRVAVNPRYPNLETRPVKDVNLNMTVQGVRAAIGSICGKLIKVINRRYTYREVSINNATFAAVCE